MRAAERQGVKRELRATLRLIVKCNPIADANQLHQAPRAESTAARSDRPVNRWPRDGQRHGGEDDHDATSRTETQDAGSNDSPTGPNEGRGEASTCRIPQDRGAEPTATTEPIHDRFR